MFILEQSWLKLMSDMKKKKKEVSFENMFQNIF